MNITKFLLIDASLMLIGIPFLLIIQSSKAKDSLVKNLNSAGLIKQFSMHFPGNKELAELEKIARSDGSGIESEALIGLWKFFSVWKQKNDKEDLIASSLLRLFGASLEIRKDESNQFVIANSIQFGSLSIRFSGFGSLKGKQPLLPFYFDCIELKAGSSSLFRRSLEKPKEQNMPFFALISIEENGKWLSARGQGGAVVIWLKE